MWYQQVLEFLRAVVVFLHLLRLLHFPELPLANVHLKIVHLDFYFNKTFCLHLKIPTSDVFPKRFFIERSILYDLYLSPSKYITVSTMCSKIFGPAMFPSFVTWPIIIIVIFLVLQSALKYCSILVSEKRFRLNWLLSGE